MAYTSEEPLTADIARREAQTINKINSHDLVVEYHFDNALSRIWSEARQGGTQVEFIVPKWFRSEKDITHIRGKVAKLLRARNFTVTLKGKKLLIEW